MTIRAVAFDLDGTLAEFNLDYKSVRAEIRAFLINQKFPASIFSRNESVFEMLEKAEVLMRNNGRAEEDASAVQERALDIVFKREIKAARETSLLPGVFETLRILKDAGLRLAIFTINGKRATDFILHSFHLTQFFEAVVTRETVSRVKPDPSHLAAAVKALNVNYDEVIVVGDSVVDMRSAKALDVKAAVCIVSEGSETKKLIQAGATHTIESITKLPALITDLDS